MPPASSELTIAVVGALHTGSERGLTADLLAARALGLVARPVCTALVLASHGRVTDVTDVPADTVSAAFEHLAAVAPIAGVKAGALGGPKTVNALFRVVEALDVPFVLDLVLSGLSGETLLSDRGREAALARWGRADLVTLSRRDAELVTGGEIRSLDDAQVAAQRAHRRGARRVLIRCGTLPARFFEADDPGAGGDGQPTSFMADLYYDGEAFALFEAPQVVAPGLAGSSSALAVAALHGLLRGRPLEEALQGAKRFATESVRHAQVQADGVYRLNFDWYGQP